MQKATCILTHSYQVVIINLFLDYLLSNNAKVQAQEILSSEHLYNDSQNLYFKGITIISYHGLHNSLKTLTFISFQF